MGPRPNGQVTRGEAHRTRPTLPASMGPRPDCHGRHGGRRDNEGHEHSIRQRPRGRGRQDRIVLEKHGVHTSMGSCPRGRGKAQKPQASAVQNSGFNGAAAGRPRKPCHCRHRTRRPCKHDLRRRTALPCACGADGWPSTFGGDGLRGRRAGLPYRRIHSAAGMPSAADGRAEFADPRRRGMPDGRPSGGGSWAGRRRVALPAQAERRGVGNGPAPRSAWAGLSHCRIHSAATCRVRRPAGRTGDRRAAAVT